ncbi:MAG: hypothetical protein CSA95_04855 [Bacteroidetes bacterium]|nr:MAG: hypothetical protein CSA95_04855 [Bacteroidota bacterium]
MDKKLTLSLNESIIESAKIYAKSNSTSLSKLVESYLSILTKKKTEKVEVTPLVKSLSGVIDLSSDFDEKELYRDYLIEKYK